MKKSLVLLLFLVCLTLFTGCKKHKPSDNPVNIAANHNVITITPTPTSEPSPSITPITTTNLFPAYVTIEGVKKYGYIDDTGTFVIEPKYNAVSDFSEGLALVTDENETKYINTNEEVIFTNTENIYLSSSFVNGAAVINQYDNTTSKYGYIDTSGNIILEPIYDRADDFNEDGTAFVIVNGKYEKINKTGDILDSTKINSRYSNILDFKDGYIIYEDPDTQTAGVIDYKGNIIIAPPSTHDIYPIYKAIMDLGNGLFGVGDTSKSYNYYTLRPYAIMDATGEQVTDYNFFDLSAFHNGYASTTDDNNTYFINEKGAIIASLPKVLGRGTLTMMGNVIQSDIDGMLSYLTLDGTTIWNSLSPLQLTDDITINSVKFKSNKFVTVYYPVIEGLPSKEVTNKINLTLKKKFTSSRKDLTIEDELSVEDSFQAELLHSILIINHKGYDYYFGAAHGMPIKNYYHFDLSSGELFSLSDLFHEGADYVSAISNIIGNKIEQAQKSEDSLYFDGFSTITKNQYFHLTAEGLVIYFYPYDIAPYAAGFPEFLITYDELANLINYSSPLWIALQK